MTTVVVVGIRWNAMFVVSERMLREKIDLGLQDSGQLTALSRRLSRWPARKRRK
jgi:hypothetical protein